MANTVNQGGGRLTKGANARIGNKKALQAYSENYSRAKQIRNQRIVLTDGFTLESVDITRTQFTELTARAAASLSRNVFEAMQADLFAGKRIEIEGDYFQMLPVGESAAF